MATTTHNKPTQPPIDAAFEQAKELNEQLLDTARRTGVQYLEYYEKAVDRAIDLERKLAGSTKQEWLKSLIEAHADAAHELTDAYTTAARGLLK